jgi:hypothetical protein
MRFSFPLALIGALTAAFPLTARGQGPGPRITGVSIERFYEGSSYFTAFMYHRTDLPERAAATGIDVALGMVPVALAIPSLQLQVDAGVAGGLPVGPVTLLLRGGAGNFVRLFPANDISIRVPGRGRGYHPIGEAGEDPGRPHPAALHRGRANRDVECRGRFGGGLPLNERSLAAKLGTPRARPPPSATPSASSPRTAQ